MIAIAIMGVALATSAQDTAWVDKDGSVTYGDGTNDRNFISLDSVLSAIERDRYDVEVIVFAGSNQHTYNWTKYVGEKPGTIKFVGAQDDPNLFPVINHTDGSTYNLGNNNSLTFEKVVLAGSLPYELGNSNNTHVFQQCVFKNNSGTCAVLRSDGGGVTRFENCLFVNNTCSNLFDISFDYGGVVSTLVIINCTFDGNRSIWKQDGTEVEKVAITNCIFSNNGTLYRGNNLRGRTTYSLTSESIKNYGTGCIQHDDQLYAVNARSIPDDWRPMVLTPARNLGTASGAPVVDISDTVRIQDTTDRRDAGCWDIRDTVTIPVIIENIPSGDTLLAAGSALTLSVTASGLPRLSYSWYIVGDYTKIGSDSSYTFNALTVANDNNKVYCLVENGRDTVSTDTTTIVVATIPVITENPVAMTAYEGDDVTFTVAATGKRLSYIWTENGTSISGATAATYQKSSVLLSDSAAKYMCIVSNCAGTVTSTSALLEVFHAEPQIIRISNDTTVIKDNPLTLHVAARGRSPLRYTWYQKGNTDILSKTDSLVVSTVTVTGGAVYRCIVTNSDGVDSEDVTVAVEKPVPKEQVITYFTDHDTIRVLGNAVWLRKIGKNPISITDTIKPFLPEKTPEGFIVVGNTGFDLAQDRESDPIAVGLVYNSARVSSYSVNDIRLYQYRADANEWITLHDVSSIDQGNNIVWTELRPNEYPFPFLLMIDTAAPSVSICSDTVRPVSPDHPVSDTIIIKDNSANCRYMLSYWFPDERAGRVVNLCTTASDTVIITIPKDSVTTRNSVRAFLTVSDGADSSSLIISHRVKRTNTDPFISLPEKWVPVFTTSILDSPQIEVALKMLNKNGAWEYDSTQFRIFRWAETSANNADRSLWIEYSERNSTYFSVVPGRVLWLKTRERERIPTLGRGTTVGVKEPFEIVCYGNKQWTDIASPYQFDVTVNDIITATGEATTHDNIAIYRWIRDKETGIVYTAPKYIPGVTGFDDPAVVLTSRVLDDSMGTYTLFNGGTGPLFLKIPPVPVAFSRNDYGNALKKKQVAGWSILVRPAVANGKITPVCCGYSSDGDGTTTYPCAPSFSRQHVSVMDGETDARFGTMIYHGSIEGGTAFPLAFTNESDSVARFSFDVERLTALPEDYSILLCQTGRQITTDMATVGNVTVASQETALYWLLVGDSTYIATWKHQAAAGFDNPRLDCYPNPFNGLLHVQLYLPTFTIDRIRFSMINHLGQCVWKQDLHENQFVRGQIQRVLHSYTLQPRLSAGTYILKVQVLDKAGGGYSRKQRVLYLPH